MKNSRNDSILAQIQMTFCRENMLAAVIALLFGGVIPIITFVVKHYDIKADVGLFAQVTTYIVAAGMIFSSLTVYKWALVAYRTTYKDSVGDEWTCWSSYIKAFGTVVLIEGTMVFSGIYWLSCLALGILILVNGVAVACNLVLDWQSRRPQVVEKSRVSHPNRKRLTA
jgi:hypothetical protein